jgi:hypothetical protein
VCNFTFFVFFFIGVDYHVTVLAFDNGNRLATLLKKQNYMEARKEIDWDSVLSDSLLDCKVSVLNL